MSIYGRLTSDRPAFEDFYAEASGLVTAIAETASAGTASAGTASAELSVLKRQVHTPQGNCALFGIESVAELCHAIEGRMEDSGTLDDEDRDRLRATWALTTAT